MAASGEVLPAWEQRESPHSSMRLFIAAVLSNRNSSRQISTRATNSGGLCMSEILQNLRPTRLNRPRAKHWSARLPGDLAPS
jgi:hypothetical protein